MLARRKSVLAGVVVVGVALLFCLMTANLAHANAAVSNAEADLGEPLPLSTAMLDVADSVDSIMGGLDLEAGEAELGLIETQAETEAESESSTEVEKRHKKNKRRRLRAARRAAKKLKKLGRKVGRKLGRKMNRKIKARARKAKKLRRKLLHKLRHGVKGAKAKKLRRKLKAQKRKAKKLRRKLRHKLKAKARRAKKAKKQFRKGHVSRRQQRKIAKAKKSIKRAEAAIKRKLKHKLAAQERDYMKQVDKNNKHANTLDTDSVKTEGNLVNAVGDAARLHIRLGDLRNAQQKVIDHKAHYDRVKKRFFDYQKVKADRKAEMAKVKPYKGKLQVANDKHAKNYMHGGPQTRPSRNLNSLQKYQLKVLEREGKRQDNANAHRARIVKKIRTLYGKAKPKMGGFMMALLSQYGVKSTPAEAKLKWVKARNRYINKLRLKAEKKYLKEQEKIAKKEKKAQERKEALALIAKSNKEHDKPRVAKLAKEEDWLDYYPKNKKKMNWWGCIDCLPENDKKKSPAYKHDKKKGAAKKGAAKKKAGAKKKINMRERTLSTGKKIIIPKNLPIPKFDPSPRNPGLLQSLLEEYKVHKSAGEVKMAARQLMKKMRTAIVMSMLTEKENQEILKAKTEELEKVVATKADFPVMVKHSIPFYKPNSKIPFPDIKQGSIREDPRTMDWEVDFATAKGYLEKHWRTDRHSLDFGDETHILTRRDHEAFMKRYKVLPDKIVWKQFDGEGDAAQFRHDEVNQWRKKHPNEPLEDGTEPW